MIWDSGLQAFIPRNPIILRDLRYQQRVNSFRRGFIESVGVVTIALCFTLVMIFSVAYGLNPRGRKEYLIPIQILAWIFHASVILRLLAAGIFNVARDKGLLDSSDLILSPLTNWQLLFGKWWAAMHQMRGWMLALGIVQLGIVVSAGFGGLMGFRWSMTCGSPCEYTIYGLYNVSWFTPTRSLFIVAAATGISILETVCCTALGTAVGVLIRSKVGLICAVAFRFIPVLIFSFYPSYPWAYTDQLQWRYQQYTWFSFADGGIGAIIQLVDPTQSFQRGVLGLCAITGMFLLYTSLSLLAVWGVMRRSRP